MELGQFSVSLAVKDIAASKAFYMKLGFEIFDDHEDERWMILKKGPVVIGLFQGMFDQNILTFNPQDVRAVQNDLKAKDVVFLSEAEEEGMGPAHAMVQDPDGNTILLDQHNPNYKPTSQT